MKKILYHGSEQILRKPEYGKGARANDYGRGFYCTESEELAKEWACSRGADGYANRYELVCDGLNILNLNSGDYNILNWMALLAKNRTYWQKGSISEEAKNYLQNYFLIDSSSYDVIIGYRADDSYFSFAQDFAANTISVNQLAEAMKLGRLGEQVVLMSPKAFEQITFTSASRAECEQYFARKLNRDREARSQYRDNRNQKADIQDVYILDLMRANVTDHRGLQEFLHKEKNGRQRV